MTFVKNFFMAIVFLALMCITTTAEQQYTPEEDFEFSKGIIKKYKGIAEVVVVPPTITDDVDVAVAVTEIGEGAFANNTELKTIDLSNCTQLTNINGEYQDGAYTVGTGAFEGANKLESILLPPSIQKIEQSAFAECVKLKEIEFSNLDNLTTVEFNAFKDCTVFRKICLMIALP